LRIGGEKVEQERRREVDFRKNKDEKQEIRSPLPKKTAIIKNKQKRKI
jgi:hypothetical protein